MTWCGRTRPFLWPLELCKDRSNMMSHRDGKTKGFTSDPCIYWCWKTGKFSHIGKATWLQLYMEAERDVIGSLQTLSTEAEEMLATLASFICAAYSPKGIYINTISELRNAMASLLQAYGRKWQAASFNWNSETTCPESPHPIQSVGTGQHCSAGASVGSSPKWLPQGVRWPNETNHDKCPSSSKDHNWDGYLFLRNRLFCADLCQWGSARQNDRDTQNNHDTDYDNEVDNL